MAEESRQQRRRRERLKRVQKERTQAKSAVPMGGPETNSSEELPFVVPPRASWWRRNVTTIREAGFGGLSFACALGAWFSGGDMTLAVPVLILGFVFAAIGIGTVPNMSSVRKYALNGLVLILFVIEASFLYWHSPALPYHEGARIHIDAADAEKLKDGTYYMPVEIYDIGTQAVDGYITVFQQQGFPSRLDRAGEEAFMFKIDAEVQKLHVTPKLVYGTGSILSPSIGLTLRETKLKLSAEQFQNIQSGQMFLYYGVIFIYSDATAKRENILYVAKRCMYYDANISKHINCEGNNFEKNVLH